jgi:hypothetical protein
MSRCPTCGQEVLLNARRLLDILTNGAPHRQVYRGQNGGWFVTYGGGEADPASVQELVAAGHIQSVYSDCPNDGYHVGRTCDMNRTLAYRKGRRRKEWKTIYVDDPVEAA